MFLMYRKNGFEIMLHECPMIDDVTAYTEIWKLFSNAIKVIVKQWNW